MSKTMWFAIRNSTLLFIARKVFGINLGDKANIPVQIIRSILFPSYLFLLFRNKYSPIQYDYPTDIFTIFGTKYTGDLLRTWGRYGLPAGGVFRIEKRFSNTITLNILPLSPDCKYFYYQGDSDNTSGLPEEEP